MATTAERIRTYRGPAILSYGFRPFFLLGAIWAALVVVIWLPLLAGSLSLPTAFSPIEWHVHELVYGYVPAVMAGFDTDCDGATCGSLWGVLHGVSALPAKWTEPMRDRIRTGVAGYHDVAISKLAEDMLATARPAA